MSPGVEMNKVDDAGLEADLPPWTETEAWLVGYISDLKQTPHRYAGEISELEIVLKRLRAAALTSPPKAEAGEAVMYVEPTWPPMPGAYVTPEPRVDVREEDGGLDAGINYAIGQLCEVLDVDPRSISWDAATETLDGDVSSVICNVLRAAYGEEWSTKPEDTARIRSALLPARGDVRVTDEMVEAGLRAWLNWPDGSLVTGHSQLPRMRVALEAALRMEGE